MDAGEGVDLAEGAGGRWVMDASRWARLKEVYGAALDRAGAERLSYVDRECAGDEDLRVEVRALLQVEGDTALEAPAWKVIAGAEDEDEPALLAPGARLGRYEIVRLIGRGGMGEVYEARQESPRRRVAIKVVGSWGYSARAARRLENEAAMLARLDHPNIAGVIELAFAEIAGVGRRAYVVMEYVEGVALTEATRGKSAREKLRLFVQVCAAVEHAHQRGVLHRDLKPSNILVDATGRVRVVDFGIAREVPGEDGGASAVRTLATAGGGIVPGTMAYMSPEQASGDSRRVDTRSDVFGLGVVLFEVLAGRLPRDARMMSMLELLRSIAEEEAPGLSRFEPGMRGDLELIVRTAMAREPGRRYQSVSMLREDVERFLEHKPLAIRAPGLVYTVGKMIRRHRVASGALGMGLGALVIGLVVGAVQYRKAHLAEALAKERLAETRKLATELVTDLYDKLEDFEGVTDVRVYLAREAASRLEKMLEIESDDPAVLWDLSTACLRLSQNTGHPGSANLGEVETARRLATRAYELRERVLATAPGDRDLRRGVAAAAVSAAMICGDPARRKALMERALGLNAATLSANPGDEHVAADLSYGWLVEGERRGETGEDAEEAFVRAEEFAAPMAAKYPEDHHWRGTWGITFSAHAQWLGLHDPDEAAQIFRKAREILAPQAAKHPEDYSMTRHMAKADSAEAEWLARHGRMEEAIALADRVVAGLRERWMKDRKNSFIRGDLAAALESAARVRQSGAGEGSPRIGDGREQAREAKELLLMDRPPGALSMDEQKRIGRIDRMLGEVGGR